MFTIFVNRIDIFLQNFSKQTLYKVSTQVYINLQQAAVAKIFYS